jgi:hypothetical protein
VDQGTRAIIFLRKQGDHMDSPVLPYVCMFSLVCLNPVVCIWITWYLTKYGSPIVLRSRRKTTKDKRQARPTLNLNEEEELED